MHLFVARVHDQLVAAPIRAPHRGTGLVAHDDQVTVFDFGRGHRFDQYQIALPDALGRNRIVADAHDERARATRNATIKLEGFFGAVLELRYRDRTRMHVETNDANT